MSNTNIGVYWLVHHKSGKKYIGSSGNLYQRQQIHIASLRRGDHFIPELQQAFNSDSNISFQFFNTLTRDEAYQLEQIHLNTWWSTGMVFNRTNNALCALADGFTHPRGDEWKRNIAVAQTGKTYGEETKEKLRNAHANRDYSKVFDQEARNKMTQAKESKMKPVNIDGVSYKSIMDASRALSVDKATLLYRLSSKSDKFKSWFYD